MQGKEQLIAVIIVAIEAIKYVKGVFGKEIKAKFEISKQYVINK